jgi:hypothetical protein
VFMGAAVTEPFQLRDSGGPEPPGDGALDTRPTTGVRPMHALAAALVLLGALALAFSAVDEHAGRAVLLVFLAPALAVWIGQPPQRTAASGFLAWLSAVYGCGVLVLACWLASREPDSGEADASLTIALGSIDVLAFTLVKRRFGELGAFERRADRSPTAPVKSETQRAGPHAWIQVVGFAVPALFGLFVLIHEATPGLGIDDYARGGPPDLDDILLGLLVALPTAAIAGVIAVLARRREPQPKLRLPLKPPAVAVVLSAVAASVWAVFVLGARAEDLHYPAVAIVGGLVAAALTAEDIARTGASLHLARLGPRGGVVAASGALISGVAVFWLLSTGLWSAERPAELGEALLAALLSLGGALALTAVLALVVGFGLQSPVLTPQHPAMNLIMAQLQYVPLILLTAAFPVVLIGRGPDTGVDNPGLNAGAIVFSIVGIGFIVVWIMQTLWEHLVHELGADPPRELRFVTDSMTGQADESADLARRLNERRGETLKWHIYWQFAASGFLLLAGLGWVLSRVG